MKQASVDFFEGRGDVYFWDLVGRRDLFLGGGGVWNEVKGGKANFFEGRGGLS